MDNLTHSLVGAIIGQTGLKRLSGLGMPTLIVAANLPDIDVGCFAWLDGVEHLAFRRGITHGPLAMLILPVLLTGAMVAFDRWQARRGTRPAARLPVRPAQLWLLALIGTLSHPAFDWLNNYGVRLLEPFSHRWFYGDTLFIIDVWLLAILIGGWLWSWRAEKAAGNWQRRGRMVATVAGLYVFANGLITARAEMSVWGDAPYPQMAVANAVPLQFWRRDVEWRGRGRYGMIPYSAFGPTPLRAQSWDAAKTTNADDPRIAAVAARDPQFRAFLFWSRMPVAEFAADTLTLRDQRFMSPMVGDRFSVRAALLPSERTPTR